VPFVSPPIVFSSRTSPIQFREFPSPTSQFRQPVLVVVPSFVVVETEAELVVVIVVIVVLGLF